MGEDRIVVVGVDGSAGSAVALRWALDHADQLGAVEPVMTFVNGPLEHGLPEAADPEGPGDPYRVDAVERLHNFLEANAPALVGAGVVIEQRTGPGLVKAARSAELLVVGTRGSSGRLDLSVGSVGAYCVRHATVPVALIPHDVPPIHDHLDVVVGVDGSMESSSALHWVLTHLRRSSRVTVVRAYADDHVIGEPLAPSAAQAETTARAELEQQVAAQLRTLPERHPEVALAVVAGDPRSVLRAASAAADLLVIGARGRGVIDHLLLGSVASALAHHPTVPTVVVPHDVAPTPPSD
jgi:nucleotide-binding universal stress UspA family protein